MKHQRRGFTLLELLCVIFGLGSMLTVLVTLLAAVIRTEERSLSSLTESTNRTRFADQLRNDVHAATKVEKSAAKQNGRLVLNIASNDGSQIVYAASNGRIVRQLKRTGEVVAQEEFRLGAGEPQIEVSDAPAIVQFTFTAHKPKATATAVQAPTPHPLHVEAVIGRDVHGKQEGAE